MTIDLLIYKASNYQEFYEFLYYLENTLIPGLRQSGLDATADDFETCIGYMSGKPVYSVQYPGGVEGRLLGEDIERLCGGEFDGADIDISLEVRNNPDDQRSGDGR